MKFLPFYKEKLGLENPDQVFNYLLETLKPSNRTWWYFVNWEKVYRNVKKLEISLNLLNYLIGKDDFDKAFREIVAEQPKVVEALPALAAIRGTKKELSKFKVLVDYSAKQLRYADVDFTKENPTEADILTYLDFLEGSGLKKLLQDKRVKNLVDYCYGIEAGLDSNGRKNRSGHVMEDIVEHFVADVCRQKGLEYIKEANAEAIKKKWSIEVPVDKSSRRFDFVINTPDKLTMIETNFYGGGGSKLKATAGEYRTLNRKLGDKFCFIWITDGIGWRTTDRPLREAFDEIEHIYNLAMLEFGIMNTMSNKYD